MKHAGCKFAYYHPTHSWRVDRTNRRSHRRILVTDGRTGFTGGIGFAKRWGGHAQDEQHWRDVQLRVQRPLVATLQSAFQQHWAKTSGDESIGADQFPGLAAAGNNKSANRELAFPFHCAGTAGASSRIRGCDQTNLDHQRLLYSNV